ncbi:MAG: HK97 family phage prohead protease [Dehalococcoidia bacterium]
MEISGAGTERERWERERLLESLEAYRAGLADAPFVQKYAVNLGGLTNPDRPLTFVASDEAEDRLGDVVRADGWDLHAYIHNPVFLWAHDHTRTPIGRSAWVGVDGGRLLATVEFAPTDFAREVETLYRQRFLRAVSVGFRPAAFTLRKGQNGAVDGVEFTKQELLEISAVAVPANPRALAKALDGGLAVPRLRPLFTFPARETEEAQADAVLTALRGLREALAVGAGTGEKSHVGAKHSGR